MAYLIDLILTICVLKLGCLTGILVSFGDEGGLQAKCFASTYAVSSTGWYRELVRDDSIKVWEEKKEGKKEIKE